MSGPSKGSLELEDGTPGREARSWLMSASRACMGARSWVRAVLGEDGMELRGLGTTRLRVQGGVEGAMTQREETLAGEVENQEGMMSPKLVEGGTAEWRSFAWDVKQGRRTEKRCCTWSHCVLGESHFSGGLWEL